MKYLICLVLFLLVTVSQVNALTIISVDADNRVPVDSEFIIPISINANGSINTISGKISIPENIEVKRIESGGSIINFWIDKPIYDDAGNSVVFSGIIPGGFLGKGTILRLVAVSSVEGDYTLSNSVFDIYTNGPDAEKEKVDLSAPKFTVSKGIVAKSTIKDIDLPESFIITITHDPLIHDGKWLAFFSTQDKGEGISRYEIAEKSGQIENDYKNLSWEITESPAILKDQDLKSYTYIKAVDESGNERIEFIAPKYPVTPLDRLVYEFLPLLLLIFIAYITWRLWRKQFTIKV